MRLGKIKQTIEKVLDSGKLIEIKQESIFSGQAYLVKNYKEIIDVLDLLFKQKWNELDYAPIAVIKEKYKDHFNPVQLDQTEFSQLNSYVSSINQKIVFYYSILEQMVDKQDGQVVNIKLSDKIKSLNDLSEQNTRLSNIFKLFKLDGDDFEFKGFDKGSEWYEILIPGKISYLYLMACLLIAEQFLKVKKAHFESEEAKISYEITAEKSEEKNDKGFKTYENNWMKKWLEKQIQKVIDKIGKTNGKADPEMHTTLVKATESLVKELGSGVEFHLSLNPPNYIKGDVSGFRIDYKKLQEINENDVLEDKKPSQIEAPKEKNSEK